MKKFLVVLALGGFCLLSFNACCPMHHHWRHKGAKAEMQGEGKYVCKMCNYSQDKPGKCPKCGMELEKK
jgi:rubrerythrin